MPRTGFTAVLDPVGHFTGTIGHDAEFGGHDPETGGHDGPKYALGHLPIDKFGADIHFQIISHRYERGSIEGRSRCSPTAWAAASLSCWVGTSELNRSSSRLLTEHSKNRE